MADLQSVRLSTLLAMIGLSLSAGRMAPNLIVVERVTDEQLDIFSDQIIEKEMQRLQ